MTGIQTWLELCHNLEDTFLLSPFCPNPLMVIHLINGNSHMKFISHHTPFAHSKPSLG